MNPEEAQFHYTVLGIFVAILFSLSVMFARQSVEKKEFLFRGILGLLSISTLVLIFVGAMVASTRSGMAFMDWPTSNGLIWPGLDKWIHQKDMFWEHIHRLIAEGVGYLAICTLIWSFFVHDKKYIKPALILLTVIIIQGIFGGLTVKRLTAWWTSSLHGVVAQLVLCYMVLLYFSVSKSLKNVNVTKVDDSWLTKLPKIVCVVVLIQLVLGASFRHKMKVANFASVMNEAHIMAMASEKGSVSFRLPGEVSVKVKHQNNQSVDAQVLSETGEVVKLHKDFEQESADEFITLGKFTAEKGLKYSLRFNADVTEVQLIGQERVDFLKSEESSELDFRIVYKEVLEGNKHLLWSHIAFAIVVTVFVLLMGFYLIKKDHGNATLKSIGKYVLISLIVQLLLGLVALLTVSERQKNIYDQLKTILTSAHLANGAVLLALCALAAYFCNNLFNYEEAGS
ncbi:MAG: COX15/CtaA family protein [Lentisphaerales bacterium]|nr:COX15/CtaA family protein [Lentisphaerales bacterium]